MFKKKKKEEKYKKSSRPTGNYGICSKPTENITKKDKQNGMSLCNAILWMNEIQVDTSNIVLFFVVFNKIQATDWNNSHSKQ